jgi:DNA-binding MarR family transcriptional regulator
MAQYAALRALADHPDASASELARLCFVTRQSLQDLLSTLRSAGFVKDANRPPRGRARALELTSVGTKRLAAAHTAVMSVESAMVDGISSAARRQLAASLTRCADNLEAAL